MIYVLIDLPVSIKGFVRMTVEPDGDYATVILNARQSREQQQRTYLHEIDHINNWDKWNGSADEIERKWHEKNGNLYKGID